MLLTSCDSTEPEPEPEPEITTAYDFIADSDDHTSLKAAIDQADLATTLSDENATFTIFAPTNDAFATFLSDNGFASLGDVPTDVLTNLLLNHVLGSKVNSSDLSNTYVSTLSPTSFGDVNNPIYTSMYVNVDNGVVLNGVATVTSADNDVDNGTIHVTNAVIGLPTVVTFATSNAALSSLVASLTVTGLPTDFVGTLSGAGPFTVFAPTNDAFQALLDSNPNWNSPSDIDATTLDAVLKYHVTTAGNVRSGDLSDNMMVPTLQGSSFTINTGGANPVINAAQNTANIVTSLVDIQATNGVVHVIDAVILPQ
jgi:uncharacterized surface protein with fasciclin (FAS1) repeats